jgi:DNA-binding transcriptional LysR family regulator
MQRHPGLEIETVMSNAVADLLRRDADIAIRLTAPKQQALVARKVAAVGLGLYATRSFLKHHKAPVSYDEFARTGRFISEDRRDDQRRAFAALGRAFPEHVVYHSGSDVAQLAALRAGLGIGICQNRIAARDRLVRVLPEVSARLECWVVMHEELRKVQRMRLVFDHLVAALERRDP